MPDSLPDLSRKPILILAGTRDSLVPREETERLGGLLERAGADLTLRWADASHSITGEEVAATREWLSANFPDG
jgi:phospholipase/carboxylesterase